VQFALSWISVKVTLSLLCKINRRAKADGRGYDQFHVAVTDDGLAYVPEPYFEFAAATRPAFEIETLPP
jgi:hypothetical protein